MAESSHKYYYDIELQVGRDSAGDDKLLDEIKEFSFSNLSRRDKISVV